MSDSIEEKTYKDQTRCGECKSNASESENSSDVFSSVYHYRLNERQLKNWLVKIVFLYFLKISIEVSKKRGDGYPLL